MKKYTFTAEQAAEIEVARRGNKDKKIEARLKVLALRADGNPATEETAQKIADALHIDFDKLFQPSGDPQPLSGQTILHYHRLISVILQTAVEWQYIPANPAERVKPPKANNHEAQYLDDKQAIRLLELLDTQPIYYKTAVQVLLFTGMRRGELLGLEWTDIDFDNQTITIQRSLQYLPEVGVFKDETKTKSSHRVIKVPSSALVSLRQYRTWQRMTFLKNGLPWNESCKWAPQRILCKRFSTKSRISRYQWA